MEQIKKKMATLRANADAAEDKADQMEQQYKASQEENEKVSFVKSLYSVLYHNVYVTCLASS